MKLKKKIRLISFALVILTVVMLLPFGTLTAYATDNNPQSDELPADETSTDSQNIADPPEEDEPAEPAADEAELETEVLYYEYEIENSAMTAPPMTDVGGVIDPYALELETSYLQSGVYAIENVGNDNYYMAVENASYDSGARVVQQNYGTSTPLTSFSRAALFKVTRIGETNRYIIRAMTNNRLSIWSDTDINEGKMITEFINTDDDNVSGSIYTIIPFGSNYLIQPYGSTYAITAPNSTSSGDSNSEAAQLILASSTATGNRSKWRFTAYTGNEKHGHQITRTAGMGDGLVKGKTGTIWLKTWSTVINANTPYLAIKSPSSLVATANWQANNYLATITAHKSGDYQMEIQTRIGSSTTVKHTQYTTYTVIPDIVGDMAYVQNVGTGRYMEVESAAKTDGGIVQIWSFHTQPQMHWQFELAGGGYFKIKNVNSGKYLSRNQESETSIAVKQYSTVNDCSLWKIVETSAGNLLFICKDVEDTSKKFLSAPSSTSGDGTDLRISFYDENTDYREEWTIINYSQIKPITIKKGLSLFADLTNVRNLSPCNPDSFTYSVLTGSAYVSIDNTTGKITGLNTGIAHVKAVHKATGDMFIFKVAVVDKAIIIIPGIFGSELFIKTAQGNFAAGDHLVTTEIISSVSLIELVAWPELKWSQYIKGSASETKIKCLNSIYDALSCDDNGNSIYDVYTKKYDPELGSSGNPTYTANCGILDIYADLYNHFDDDVSISDEYIVEFFSYDWRLSNEVSAERLNEFINAEGYEEVVLVAHSMGGLVASGYLAMGQSQRNKVEKVCMLASPLLGTPQVINVWANLDISFLNQNVAPFADFINAILSCVTLTNDAMRTLMSNYKSVYELLPTERYLNSAISPYLKKTSRNLVIPDMSYVSLCADHASSINLMAGYLRYFDMNLMNAADSFHNSCYIDGDHVSRHVDTRYICSSQNEIITQIHMFEVISTTDYVYEFEVSAIENVGDGLVPYWSATAGLPLSNSSVKTFGNKYHMNFVKHEDVIEEITTCILS